MIRSIVIFLLFFGTVFAQEKYTPEHPVAPDPKNMVIVIDHGEVKVNGCILNFPARIEMMERFFGYPSRYRGTRAFVWDDYGLSVVSEPYDKSAVGVEFRVYVQRDKGVYWPASKPSEDKVFLVTPDNDFSGELVVDGVEITKDLTRDQFVLWKNGKGIKKRIFL